MSPYIFIFDTNTLISAVLRPNSVPAQAFRKGLLLGEIVCSPETLKEFTDVINRSKFDRFSTLGERQKFLKDYVDAAINIKTPPLNTPICRDPKDNKYLALSLSAKAHYIITGDADLLVLNPFHNTVILKSAAFLELDFSIEY